MNKGRQLEKRTIKIYNANETVQKMMEVKITKKIRMNHKSWSLVEAKSNSGSRIIKSSFVRLFLISFFFLVVLFFVLLISIVDWLFTPLIYDIACVFICSLIISFRHVLLFIVSFLLFSIGVRTVCLLRPGTTPLPRRFWQRPRTTSRTSSTRHGT